MSHVSDFERIEALKAIAGFRRWMNWDPPEDSQDALLSRLPDAPAGRCDDCGENARLRRKLGKFTLCLGCVGLRMRAGFKSAVRLESERKGEAS